VSDKFLGKETDIDKWGLPPYHHLVVRTQENNRRNNRHEKIDINIG